MGSKSLVGSASVTPWVWVYAAAGLVVVCGAVLVWVGAPRWTARVSRFERSATGPSVLVLRTLEVQHRLPEGRRGRSRARCRR